MVNAGWRERRLGRYFWPIGSSIVACDGRLGGSVDIWQKTVKKVDLIAALRLAFEETRVHVPVGLAGAEQWLKETVAALLTDSATTGVAASVRPTHAEWSADTAEYRLPSALAGRHHSLRA